MFLIKDLMTMIRDIRSASKGIGIWGRALNVPQILGGLILLNTLEGATVFVTVIGTLIIASQIHKRLYFSRLIGLCHIPWLILAPWLTYRLQSTKLGLSTEVWLTYVVVTMFISLLFDIYDVVRYLKGSKTFEWSAQRPNY
ncbi:MAG: hypothetical protein GY786_04540 [Proteobacteria bacterium]|nr:hypothetical protein [Pseudomonadota bacterium]